jgi:hypothetical protein
MTAEDADELTKEEMQRWLETEISLVNKAAELRLKEAAAFTEAYVKGEISPEEAGERRWQYSDRWGEALPGVIDIKGMTDEQIIREIDETRRPDFIERMQERSKRLIEQMKQAPNR